MSEKNNNGKLEEKDVKKNFMVSKSENDQLKKYSKQLGIPQSQLIRQALYEKYRRINSGNGNRNFNGIQDIVEAILFNVEESRKDIIELREEKRKMEEEIKERDQIMKDITNMYNQFQKDSLGKHLEGFVKLWDVNAYYPKQLIELSGLEDSIVFGLIGELKKQDRIINTKTGKMRLKLNAE